MQSCGHGEEAIDDWPKTTNINFDDINEFTLIFEVNCFSQFLPFSVIFEQPVLYSRSRGQDNKKM